MKRIGVALSLFGLALIVGCSKPVETKKLDPNQADLDAFQGTWVLESGIGNGKPFKSEYIGKVTLTVSGDRYTIVGGKGIGTSGAGTIKIDATKSPKEVDSTATEGQDAGQVYLGIYEIRGDKQRACFAAPGEPRPTEFASEPGSKMLLQVWKRSEEKPAE
jgi:uncharacterized protein (TIGR03067 family)